MQEFPNSSTMPASVLRKIKKPIIEKKRRDRINNSLEQLKGILLENVRKTDSQISRLDKADILEMTVKYIQQLQKQEPKVSRLDKAESLEINVKYLQPLPREDNTSIEEHDDTQAKEYKYEYEKCLQETFHYLNSADGITHDTKSPIEDDLSSCIVEVNDVRSALKDTRNPLGSPVKSSYLTPFYVDIPRYQHNIHPAHRRHLILMKTC
ncbi:hypothetical protein CHS0354_035746 [Potamilus streckersoni]|uniref:BHLH domain-containing protein n=1 Tax=Potamilus streckersoni TaxID=2493646 RepID=A0AAE0VLM0_9BIVA|nr:hypothetical protein CHS0354_035746 [Potamilus streckersoni]